MFYDGFISYSHSADGLLAPRLQAGLQRFAKPWWKRRALRIFRDESSLSANPHLWESIATALEDSGWFVVLLSPEAAESDWVNQEINHWIANKDRARVLPVVTAGTFEWRGGKATGSAVPPALQEVFASEPRWVDLRFARGDEQLDLSNPSFSAAVADIASALRGVPKDELESEEVREHRRTRRTAWSAAGLLVVLFAASIVAATTATDRASDARANRLAAASVNVVDDDPELSLLLALASGHEAAPSLEQTRALHQAIDRDRAVATIRVDISKGWTTTPRISPSGEYVAVSGNPGVPLTMHRLGPSGPEQIWSGDFPEGWRSWTAFTADSRYLLVFADWPGSWDYSIPREPEEPDMAGLHLFDVATGELVGRPSLPECDGPAWVALPAYDVSVPPEIVALCGDRTYVIDSLTGEVEDDFETPEGVFDVTLSQDTRRLMIAYYDKVVVVDRRSGESWELLFDLPNQYSESFPIPIAGLDRFLLERWVLDPMSGEVTELELPPNGWEGCGYWPGTSPTKLVVGCEDGSALVYDPITGELLDRLVGHTGWQASSSFAQDESLVATGSADGTVRVWNLSQSSEVRHINLGSGHYTDASVTLRGRRASLLIYPSEQETVFDPLYATMVRPATAQAVVFDVTTGEVLSRIGGLAGKAAPISPDGTKVVAQIAVGNQVAGAAIFEVASGSRLLDLGPICPWAPEQWFFETPADCDDGTVVADATDFAWSPDGSMVAMAGGVSKRLFVWDALSGALLHRSEPLGFFPVSSVTFDNAGKRVVLSSKTGMWVHDVPSWQISAEIFHTGRPSWELIFSSDDAELITAQAHSGDIRIYDTTTWDERHIKGGIAQTRDIDVSSDGTSVAIASRDGKIHVLNLATGNLVDLISLDNRDITNVAFVDGGRHLLITSEQGPVEFVTLDPVELLEIAAERASRSFTERECVTYDLDPCPSLEDLRG